MAITAILPARTIYFVTVVTEIQSLSTTDDAGGIVSYTFDMGDGTIISGNTDTAFHRYSTAANRTVSLTVENSIGETDTTTVDISVIEPVINTSKQLRKYITQFMDIFNGMQVANKDDVDITVPIVYGGSDRVVSYIRNEDTNGNARTSISLPLLSAKLVGIDLDVDRLKGTHQKRYQIGSDNTTHEFTTPTPVSLTFDLGIWSYDYGQAFTLLETIVPWFNPDIYVNIGDMDPTTNNSLILESIGDETDLDIGTGARIVRYNIQFKLKGWLPRDRHISDHVTTTHVNFL